MHLDGFLMAVTGSVVEEYYDGHHLVCSLKQSVIPSPPVYISGWQHRWISSFDEDRFRKNRERLIKEEKTGSVMYTCRYIHPGRYELTNGSTVVSVIEEEGEYSFFCKKEEIATIRKAIQEEYTWIPERQGYETEYYRTAEISDCLAEEMILVILSFPLLK